MRKIVLLFNLLLVFTISFSQQLMEIPLGKSAWYSGISFHGPLMPMVNGYKADFDSNYGNQAQPLLISNDGQTVWSEQAYKVSIKNDTIVISSRGDLIYYKSGNTLKDAFKYASKNYFPPTGILPDELLFSAPQYNTWIELMYDQNQDDILQYANNIKSNGYPAGVLMVDDNWQEDYGKWDFHHGRFSNPKLMMDSLHNMGFKVMVWICPFVSPDCDVYRMLDAKNMLLKDTTGQSAIVRWWNGASGLLDLSNPETMTWFKKELNYLQIEYGVDGFKFDAGDFEYYKNLVPHSTLTGIENISQDQCEYYARLGLDYPLNEYRAMWKMAGQPLVNRLRDKAHNWADLQTLVPGMLLQGIVGYNFTCPDMIGGGEFTSFLAGSVIDQELIVRSAQVHALMPMMQFSVAPWRILDELHLSAIDDAVKLRQKYTPIIMELSNESAKSGEPIVRSLEYVFPHNEYAAVLNQFMLGNNLLIAPIMKKGTTEKKVVLPPGKWKSWQGKKYKGGKSIVVNVGLNDIPVFELVK